MAHDAVQQVGSRAEKIAEPYPVAAATGQPDQVVDRVVNSSQRFVDLGQPGPAQLSQRDFAGAASEQHDAELLFEMFDRRRQRGLCDEQPLGCAPVVELLAEYDEVAQLAQRDVTARVRALRR